MKQWFKIFNELLTANLWRKSGSIEEGNVRLFCPLMIVESAPVVAQESKQDDEQSQDDISAKRSAAANARWALKREQDAKDNANGDFASCKTNANDMQNENLHDEKPMQNDANGNFAYANTMQMGGRGEDLDSELKQDLDKEQEVKTKTPRGASVSDARFDEFWIQYPRKENKQGALKAWKKLKPSESLYQQIILAVATQKTWPSWMSGYAPHAMTWLNGSRWDDQQANIIPMPNKPKQSSQMTDAERKAAHDQMTREAKRMVFGDSDDDFIDGVASHV